MSHHIYIPPEAEAEIRRARSGCLAAQIAAVVVLAPLFALLLFLLGCGR